MTQPERIQPPGGNAAVLIPTVFLSGEPHLLFEVRSGKIIQGGEICFPGGKVEEGERPEAAAVRETAEELLIPEGQIEDIRPRNLISGPGGRDVYSYSGIIREYSFTYSREEVEEVFTVPVKSLLEQQPESFQARYQIQLPDNFPYDKIPGGRSYPWASVPRTFYFYSCGNHIIWGLTAELLHAYLSALNRSAT